MRPIHLIVNADDFGCSKEVNAAVIRAFQEGVLTSCSLMVTGEAFDEAVALAKKHAGLGVGLHLVTVCGRPALEPSEVSSLVDSRGQFPGNPRVAGLKYFFSRRARAELRQELTAQFEKFCATGLPFSHIDGHLHMHVHPVIFKMAIELGIRYNVKRMRVPQDDLFLALRFDHRSIFKKVIHASIFGLLCGLMKSRLRAEGFLFSDRVYGLFQTGKMNETYFLQVLQALHCQTNEIYFHPALHTALPRDPKERPEAEVELEALTSPRVIELLKHLAIQPIRYFELEPAR